MRSIGLTGGIGSGKSTVAGMLVDLGAVVIDADRVAHDVYRPGTPGWSQIVDAFGREIVAEDGTIDRKRLGARVFSDPEALRHLNAIVHPLIAREVGLRIDQARAEGRAEGIVVEAAVLLEARWNDLVDEVWVVVASSDLAIDRVVRGRGLVREDVERRIASQLSDGERMAAADYVIHNTGSIEDLRKAVEKAWIARIRRNREV